MMSPPRCLLALASFALLPVVNRAAELLPFDLAPANFMPLGANWQSAGGLGGDPRRDHELAPLPGSGVLINNPTKAARAHLVTTWDHGDLDLDVDFLLTSESNSGIYLMGRYEVQLFDSWAHPGAPKSSDCGGIYDRWDATRGPGKEGYDGTPPRAQAARAPGLWQHLRIEFRAPRFDASGKKIANAKFTRVVLNGFIIHENVEATGPTRSALFEKEPEALRGPLMIQGDHGAVALRNLVAQPLATTPITTSDLAYKVYTGDQKAIGDYLEPASASGPLSRFSVGAAVGKPGKFALVITGTMQVPRDATYTFSAELRSQVRLLFGDQLALTPTERGGESTPVYLTAGAHPFRLDYKQFGNGKPALTLTAQAPGVIPQVIASDGPPKPPAALKQLLIAPTDRTRLQRGFVPYEPKKRLYAISVGSPSGVNFAYDFETGSILNVWRGAFLDASEMWEGRGEPQLAKPAGPTLTLNAKPLLALLERPANDWPAAPEALWSSQGYTVEKDGTPTFLGKLAGIELRDRIAPTPEGRGLTRTLTLNGRTTSWDSFILLAEADTITRQPGGLGYIIGDREYYLDLPADKSFTPIVRTRNGRQQLVAAITGGKLDRTCTYSLVW